jgi:histidyl-tRNA synthetase
MPPKALPGFRDFYPAEYAVRAHIIDTWRRIARRYACTEYDGPPLEPLELYTQKSGDEIVGQLYAFEDKGGRAVAMRPEMTPTFARMVAARAQALRKPVRWFSVPQLFRYERQQKGRLREHFQLNVDIVGESDVLADAELLSIAIEICRAFGLDRRDFYARVSDRRLLNALLAHLGIADEAWAAVYAVLDKLERQPREISAQKLDAAGLSGAARDAVLGFGAFDSVEALRTAYGDSPTVSEHLDRFAAYAAHLHALGVGEYLRLDLTIVRGLAYYTGIVFELFDAQGEFRAICGGGRYDNLLQALGGVDLPSLGFGMGDVVLGELLKARGKLTDVGTPVADVWLVPAESTPIAHLLAIAAMLRHAEVSVEYTLSAEKLHARKSGAQLKDAQKAGARVALVFRDATHAEVVSLTADVGESARPVLDTTGWTTAVDVPAVLAPVLTAIRR